MARSPININAAMLSSGVQPLDLTNGNLITGLNTQAVQRLLDQYYAAGNFHVVFVTTGSGNIIVRQGFTPWASQASQGDLTIAVSGTNTVTDIGPQIVLQRHLQAIGGGDLGIAIDYTVVTGNMFVCFGVAQGVPAGVALNTELKKSPGLLVGAVVQTLGTAALSIYDNAAAALGTALLTIPGSAAQGSLYTGAFAKAGLVVAGVASCPAITAYFV